MSIFFGLILLIGGLYWASTIWLPNREHVDPEWLGTVNKPIFADEGERMEGSALGEGDSLKLPLPVIQSVVDPTIRYEEETGSVILTTPQKLVFLKTDEKVAQINNKPTPLRFAPMEQDGVMYLPAYLLESLYGTEIQEDPESGAVLLARAGESIQTGKVLGASRKRDEPVPLRTGPSIHQPILLDMAPDTEFRLLFSGENWHYIQLNNGYTGYVQQKYAQLGEKRTVPELKQELTSAKAKWKGGPVNMTWEAVYQVAPKPASIGKLPGVNVVSPTWFSLVDGKGNVQSKADRAYVKWAHGQGMQVWGLFSNSFEPDITTAALANFENRLNTILQMLHYAKLYDLDGINIDYENVYTKDGDNLTQFMRELRPLAEEQGLIVSIDVTPKSNSEMWSAFLDRKALGQVVDYMVLMAYDEHWAASPVAGSVSSLPWVKQSVSRILNEDGVPPEKMILGIPLYTRVWTEVKKDGEIKVSSKAIGMDRAKRIIEEKKLKPTLIEETGQNYVEYTDQDGRHRIWLEDAESLKRRVALAKSFKLAGIATWTRSFASNEAWSTLQQISE